MTNKQIEITLDKYKIEEIRRNNFKRFFKELEKNNQTLQPNFIRETDILNILPKVNDIIRFNINKSFDIETFISSFNNKEMLDCYQTRIKGVNFLGKVILISCIINSISARLKLNSAKISENASLSITQTLNNIYVYLKKTIKINHKNNPNNELILIKRIKYLLIRRICSFIYEFDFDVTGYFIEKVYIKYQYSQISKEEVANSFYKEEDPEQMVAFLGFHIKKIKKELKMFLQTNQINQKVNLSEEISNELKQFKTRISGLVSMKAKFLKQLNKKKG